MSNFQCRNVATRLLLDALSAPVGTHAHSESDWDVLVRVARASSLLGIVQARVESTAGIDRVPRAVRAQLHSERLACAYRTKLVWWEIDRLQRVLGRLDVPIVLLKGAAYIAQGLQCATGRIVSDVDILVPSERLPEVERALLAHGWAATPLEPYDDRYYRQWSHEIPPLRYDGTVLELDVHHAILPPLGRIRPDPERLLRRSVAVVTTPFRVLAPADQVVHAALHLFQDSDCTNRLRDLVDIDSLLREFGARPGFWSDLTACAIEYQAGRPLWYAARYTMRFLATPVPQAVVDGLRAHAPPRLVQQLMDLLVPAALLPSHPDQGASRGARFASWLLLMRAVWLRFPPRLFLLHSAVKAVPWLRLGGAQTPTVQ